MCRIKLTSFLKNNKIKSEQVFDNLFVPKGEQLMSNNENELISIIRENDNPELTLLTAIKVFSAFVEQLEAAPTLRPDGLQESS